MTDTGDPRIEADGHEHTFAEEQEPSGRLILGPCMICNMSAMDGLATIAAERDKAQSALAELRAWAQALAAGVIPPWASDTFGFGYSEAQTNVLMLIGEDNE